MKAINLKEMSMSSILRASKFFGTANMSTRVVNGEEQKVCMQYFENRAKFGDFLIMLGHFFNMRDFSYEENGNWVTFFFDPADFTQARDTFYLLIDDVIENA